MPYVLFRAGADSKSNSARWQKKKQNKKKKSTKQREESKRIVMKALLLLESDSHRRHILILIFTFLPSPKQALPSGIYRYCSIVSYFFNVCTLIYFYTVPRYKPAQEKASV